MEHCLGGEKLSGRALVFLRCSSTRFPDGAVVNSETIRPVYRARGD